MGGDDTLTDEYEHRVLPREGMDTPWHARELRLGFPWLATSIISQVELLMKLAPTMPYAERARLLNVISDALDCP